MIISALNVRFAGYIGGSVLAHFLKHRKRNEFEFTALVRSADKAEKLKHQFGVNAIHGSFSDSGLVEEAASRADVVLSMVIILPFTCGPCVR